MWLLNRQLTALPGPLPLAPSPKEKRSPVFSRQEGLSSPVKRACTLSFDLVRLVPTLHQPTPPSQITHAQTLHNWPVGFLKKK